MKLLLLILTLTISYMVSAQPGSYTDVPPSEWNDEWLQRALQFGADDVIQQGIEERRLPNSTFEVTQIFSVQEQVVAGLNYKFDVELGDGQITVTAEYVVYSEAGTGNLDVTSSSFDITSASNIVPFLLLPPIEEEEEEVLGGWTPVDLTTLNTDSNLRDILNFGVQYVISELSGANYYIEDVLSIESQLVSGTNYRFDVVLGDGQGNKIPVNFTVYDEPWTGTRQVTTYEVGEPLVQDASLLGSWYPIDVSELDTDQNLNDILNFGVQYVVAQEVANGQLSSSDYQPSEVYSIEGQLVSGNNYRFNAKLDNGQGGYAIVIFVVYDEPWTNTREVTSYYFLDIENGGDTPAFFSAPLILYEEENEEEEEVLGGWTPVDLSTLNTDSNLRDILSFGVQNVIVQGIEDEKLPDANYYIEDVTSIESQLVSGTNYRFNIVLGDDEGNEIPVNFTVYDEPWTGTREVTNYEVAEDQGQEEEDLLGSWHSVDVSELGTDQNLNDVLNFGVQYVVAQEVANGQLSSSDYQPSEIYSIKEQLVSGSNYRFNLRLENGEDGYATVIFVVYDQPWTNTREVTSYYFLDIQDAGIEETNSANDGGEFD